MLGRAVPEQEMLPLGRAGLAQGYVDSRPAVPRPVTIGRRSDELEGDLDALGVLGRCAHLLNLARREFARRRPVEVERILSEVGVVPHELSGCGVPVQVRAIGAKLAELKPGGHGLGEIGRDQGEHAAGDAAGRDRRQPGSRLLVELHREVGHDQHPVRLGHLLGDGVVLLDRGVFVPQVFLRHGLHMGSELGQPLLDLARVGPDLPGHERTVEIRQVHERAKVRPMPIGSTIVNRTCAGGRLVKSRNIDA